MNRVIPAIVLAASLCLAACDPRGGTPLPEATQTKKPLPRAGLNLAGRGALPDFFDCVREAPGMLIAAHRGGPAPGFPENALETLQNTRAKATPIMEIDVAESRDGVLFLLHDRTLGRTTTGDGMVADTDWQTIAGLNLKDNDGQITPFTPPKLSDVLLWAKQSGAIVELDKKETTSFRNIISHVRAAGAEDHVILITYNDNQAFEVQRLAPDLMFTATVDDAGHLKRLEEGGVDTTRLIAWTGTKAPRTGVWATLARLRGIESAFGTLGRPGERLDDRYFADGDPSEYEALYESGLVLLSTDEPFRVAKALLADDKAMKDCAK